MKLIFETSAKLDTDIDINESNTQKKYKIKGIFSTIGEKNKNGRVYPSNIWEREINEYQKVIKDGSSNTLMELNHPPRANVEMMEAVAKIEKLYIKDNYVMGEAVLLNNPKANQLKSLIDAGIKMSVSSRGVGKISSSGLVENFKLSTYDIIPDQGQSDYNAEMMGIVEGVLQDKDFEILENGCVGECSLEEKELNEESNSNVKDLKEILKKYNAEILCDLDIGTKEKVLSEFRSKTVTEDYKDQYETLLESVKEYEEYVNKEMKRKLNEQKRNFLTLQKHEKKFTNTTESTEPIVEQKTTKLNKEQKTELQNKLKDSISSLFNKN